MSFDVSIMGSADQGGQPAVRPISLGLAGLSSGIGALGDVVVTVDGVPDAARLSAGQFLGDGTWSVLVADLDRLALYPSPGRNRNCQISIRLRKIDKDMGESFSIGAVYVDVDADAERSAIAGTEGAISQRRRDEDARALEPDEGPRTEPDLEQTAASSFPPETSLGDPPTIDAGAPPNALGQANLDDPFADEAEMERIFGGATQPDSDPAPAEPEVAAPTPEATPSKKAELKPVQRVVRVTRAASSAPKPAAISSEPFPNELPPPPETPLPDEVLTDHAAQPWLAEPPAAESPYQDPSTPDLTEVGIAPPVAVSEPARPAVVPASFASPSQRVPNKASRFGKGGSMVVPVQVTPGVRIGKFGKMGHPEDVVSVRISPNVRGVRRAGGSGSIVFVRSTSDEVRTT